MSQAMRSEILNILIFGLLHFVVTVFHASNARMKETTIVESHRSCLYKVYGCMVKETHRCRSIKRGKHSINSIEFTSHFGSMVHIGSFAIGNWSWKLRKVIQLKYRIVRCLFVWHAEKYRVYHGLQCEWKCIYHRDLFRFSGVLVWCGALIVNQIE